MKSNLQRIPSEPIVLEAGSTITDPSQNLVTWADDADPENPRNWTPLKKWLALSTVSFLSCISPLTSSMIAPATPLISRDLNNDSDTFSVLVVTFFILGYVVGSLLFGRLSEIYGRRPILLISTFIFSIWQLGCALSTSIEMQMAFRLFAGFGGSGCIAIGGGIIADVFDLKDRGLAVTIFSVGPLVGPILGPIVGAYISHDLGWRAIYYFMFITSMIAEIFTFIVVKESNPQTILSHKRNQLQKLTSTPLFLENELSAIPSKSPIFDLLVSTFLPWKLLFFSPVTALLCAYMAYVYGLLYLLFTTISIVFVGNYRWSISTSSLVYVSIGVGFAIGLVAHGALSAKMLKRSMKLSNDVFEPEMRLEPCKIMGLMVPLSFFWYGWAADKQVHWAVPVVGLLPFGIGLIGVFLPIQNYMIEAFPEISASATAVLASSRNVVGTFLPIVAPSMYRRMGIGWGNTLLGFLSIIALPFAWIVARYGKSLRTRYPVKL
ncbi:hypothetical protein HBI56_102750 [Parastagonospora nodorum]|nr:hypothetical protein HBH53_091270 [Parastagonospora nodorum]KAH3956503.1 hypothetical protein HBH51_240720 [Parastagonospora nodorum]KAH3991375.1 hypothetical protein HBI10_232840 [Parastagonospora nodorum]KAH4021445.1 hypothetical protein HBI13_102810 [Parastagonospora nodorum]KAH4120156.1 hypothetical protein HBH47_120280 [Parastagonospora nodorum]